MKTECQVNLFFANQFMQVTLYLDINEPIEEQLKAIYGDKIDDFTWKETTPYAEFSTNQLFSMFNKSQDYKRKGQMKIELRGRGFFE